MGQAGKIVPVYEYMCESCNTSEAVSRGINDKDPGYSCEKCNSVLVRKFALGGVQFNGGGFYSTDKG